MLSFKPAFSLSSFTFIKRVFSYSSLSAIRVVSSAYMRLLIFLPAILIKKRWQEYTEELYKKDLHDPDNHNAMITHLETNILECEVKWALGSITTNKTSGGDGILVELCQILRDDAEKVLHSICQHIWNSAVATGLEKVSFIPIPKKGNAKEFSNYCTFVLISCASKEMLKILQARLQQYINCELEVLKLDLEKAEEPEIKLPTSTGS